MLNKKVMCGVLCALVSFTLLVEAKPKKNKDASPTAVSKRKRVPKTASAPLYFKALPVRESLELAINDLIDTHGAAYPKGPEFLKRLKQATSDAELKALQREALLANPLLADAEVMMIRRNLGSSARQLLDRNLKTSGNGLNLGIPWRNTQDNTTIAHTLTGWDTEIIIMSDLQKAEPKITSFYKRDDEAIITDLELDFDASRIMYSSIGDNDRWHVFEMDMKEKKPKAISPQDTIAEDYFDSTFLPDGRIIFSSTHQFNGIPCENGSSGIAVPMLYDPKDQTYRQLGFDQESNWNYSVMNDGRVLYLRWEYTDTAHFFTRLLFTCNPDGTNQRAFYGSNSYWPNSFYGPRAVPGHPTKVIGTVTGHHGLSRMGRLTILDPAKGTHEAEGVVQTIPGYGQKVEPEMTDRLYNEHYPKFLTPWPLDEKYILAIMKPAPDALWGLYLVDVFDNMVLIHEQEGMFYIDPIQLKKRPRPPMIPDRVQLDKKTSTVFIQDIYKGPGLKGMPRGSVDKMRLFTYNYSVTFSGADNRVGIESGWDVKVALGTVPVEKDGSAFFEVPANMPISIQPLDKDGAAMQLFRSWFTPMPGENVSCVGCHENSMATPVSTTRPLAMTKAPAKIDAWDGAARPFGFETDVQPLLTKRCVACHNNQKASGKVNLEYVPTNYTPPKFDKRKGGIVSPAYKTLQQFVRRPGPESDYHLLNPMEFHASTSELIQQLKAGHHNVELTPEEWQVLYTWIDLNAPYHGSVIDQNGGLMSINWWQNKKKYIGMDSPSEVLGCPKQKGIDVLYERRLENLKRFAGRTDDPERAFIEKREQVLATKIDPIMPKPLAEKAAPETVDGWPFDGAKAKGMQSQSSKTVQVGTQQITLQYIPAGRFVKDGKATSVDAPFYMSATEVSNELFAQFDAEHDSKYKDMSGKDQSSRGIPLNAPTQPVVRISFEKAQLFCKWLSEKTGLKVTLPTQTEWEWAARAGTDTPFWFGALTADFSSYANLADQIGPKVAPFPIVEGFNDQNSVAAAVDSYQPNPWGLRNMHGNVAEWAIGSDGEALACGGSWQDRPHRATADFTIPFAPYQPVMYVGFRVKVAE